MFLDNDSEIFSFTETKTPVRLGCARANRMSDLASQENLDLGRSPPAGGSVKDFRISYISVLRLL